MRLIVARCQIDYAGRLSTHLPEAVRLVMVKSDGAVMVHADCGGYKPLNWMTPACRSRLPDSSATPAARSFEGSARALGCCARISFLWDGSRVAGGTGLSSDWP